MAMDIRSALPSQLIAESGSDVVVINFGSASLRVGLATTESPVVVPHCIAHNLLVPIEDVDGQELRKKGSIAEQGVSRSSISAVRKAERDEICQMVESQLKMMPFNKDRITKVDGNGWTCIELDKEESIQWTQVMVENPAFNLNSPAVKPMAITQSAGEDDRNLASPTRTPVIESGSHEEGKQEAESFVFDVQSTPKEEALVMSEEETGRNLEEDTGRIEKEPGRSLAEDTGKMEEVSGVSLEEDTKNGFKEAAARNLDEDMGRNLEVETGKIPEGETGRIHEEITRRNLEQEIVHDSEDEFMKESQQQTVEDSEEEAHKELAEETVEDSEEDTPAEPEEIIQETVDQTTLGPSAQESHSEPQIVLHDISNMEIHVEVTLEPDDNFKSNSDNRVQGPTEKPMKHRHYFCGEEAINIAVNEPYSLRRPVCRGHLNINQHYSLQQVCDDIYSIWNWVLTEKLSIGHSSREQFSAVLVVPDTLDNREIKELVSIILRDLRFRSAVVHQESVAATFGNGISSACVVNMGAQVTSVVCVEDGVVLPSTRIVLPFGGEDISRCLLWVQQRWQTWPLIDTDALRDPLDLQILERLKESYCLIIEGEQHAMLEIPYHEVGRPSLAYRGLLSALNVQEQTSIAKFAQTYFSLFSCNVPVMGLFYPSLLAPEEYAAPLRPGFHMDHEDGLDESSSHVEPSRKTDTAEVVANGGNGLPLVGPSSEMFADETAGNGEPPIEETALGLSRAIVNSILSIGRADLQKKLFASIQLVGGTAYTRGLVDAVEERVLHDIPADEAVDTVAVLQNRTEAPIACWKGGAILGILDLARDAWVRQDDWVTGGVRFGSGRKYKDSYTLHSQAFYYTAAVE